MTSDYLAELGFLARQLRFQGELDSSLGLLSSRAPDLSQLSLPPINLPQSTNSAPPVHRERPQRDAPQHSNRPRQSLSSNRFESKRPEQRPVKKAPVTSRPQSRDQVAGDAIVAPNNETEEELAARREIGQKALAELFSRMDGCTKCPLHEGRNRLVFGQGDAAAEIAFIGEGPGYQEDKQGLAFCGPSGDLLSKMLKAMGLDRRDVFIANVVKCRPPNNRNPEPKEMATCLPFLGEQLEIVRPRCIVALGKTAGIGLGLLRPEESLGRNRGFQHRWRGIRVMLTYHPAYLLRNPSAKRLAWHDLKQVMPYLRRREGGAA